MKAVALQSTSHTSPAKKSKAAASPVPVSPLFNQTVSMLDGPLVQRKAACACGGGCPRCAGESQHSNIQTKLAISAPGDQYEQEADRVAEQVMRMPEAGISPQSRSRKLIQRKCAACSNSPGSCHECAEGENHGVLLRKAESEHESSEIPPIVHEVLRSAGQPLDPFTRTFFEPRLGHDFSQLRLHTDERAAASARGLNALAYTVGRDLVFGAGQYQPSTQEGRKLIAHELTHAVQQTGATPLIQRQPKPDDDPKMSRRDEIALSKRSPGEFEIGTGFPPIISLYNFGIDDHHLKKEHQAALRIVGELFGLMDPTQWLVFVVGNADSTGEPEINDPLSANRADEVRKYLNDVTKGNYFIQGAGEDRPIVTNESISGRTRNRRVDLIFNNPNIDFKIPDPIPNICQLFPLLCNEKKFCDRYPFLCGEGICAKYPEWCGLGVLCLLFPPACLCLANPAACACGRFPALCACLANPLACLKWPKSDDEPEPKRQRACPIKVELPSGVIEAYKTEDIGFAKLYFPFPMNIDFLQDSSGCECACGEYEQVVRGFFERDNGNGKWKKEEHPLTKGVDMEEDTFKEDGLVAVGPYGHRYQDDLTKTKAKSNSWPNDNDKFLLTRETGCQYRGTDEPSLKGAKKHKARVRMYLEFMGGPVDVCESPGHRVRQQQHWSSWIIHGEAHAKSPPPGPKSPPDAPTVTVTNAEETDIAYGSPVSSWYAGGIPSDATSGEHKMLVGFKVNGVIKFSFVNVRIYASTPTSVSVITTNKRNLNLNPDDSQNPIVVKANHSEQIARSTLEVAEKTSAP